MAWATTADLQTYAADITNYGVTDWSAELALAEDAVRGWIKADWWPQQLTRFAGYRGPVSNWPIDETLLDTRALAPAVCFRALGWEIFPKLAKWSDADGDMFSRRAEWFRRRYGEELERVALLPLYDWNRDAKWADYERPLPGAQVRVRRA